VALDIQGKGSASTAGSTYVAALMCTICGLGIGYGVNTPKSISAELGKYMAYQRSQGITVKKAIVDAASEVGQEFTTMGSGTAGSGRFAGNSSRRPLLQATRRRWSTSWKLRKRRQGCSGATP
jgi:hypothetical protein